jgi:prepilin-type N-terminal cleavage/methylation domain-containing protein
MTKNIHAKKGFTLVEAILVAILVGLLAAIGIIKAADAKKVVADNVLTSAIQDVNMGVQRHVISGADIKDEAGSIVASLTAGAVGDNWHAVLISSAQNGYMTDSSADNLAGLLETGATFSAAGKAKDATVTVSVDPTATSMSDLEFYLGSSV